MSGTGSETAAEIKGFLGFILRYGGFWLLFFLLCRIFFVVYHAPKLAGFPPATVLGIFGYGLYADISSACYLMVLPYLIWVTNRFIPFGGTYRLIRSYTVACIVLVSLITVADLQVYREYGSKLNAQTLAYLRFPLEALASVSSAPLGLLFFLAFLLALAGMLLHGALCARSWRKGRTTRLAVGLRIGLSLLCAGLIFLGIRGSVGVAPMNPSFVYFSQEQFANHAALNASWSLIYDVKYQLKRKGHSFVYLDEPQMRSRVARLMARDQPNQTEYLLDTHRPNIVVLILESWTADVIASLGAEKGITPYFEELVSQGLLFTDFYANGYRSSFGIPAVLAGYPSTPDGSILKDSPRMERLPTLAGSLKKAGYCSYFHYGGDDRFDDMSAFLFHSGFEKVVDRKAFAKKDMDSKWGAHDHVVLGRVLDDLKGARTPFFSATFTLSSHEPFEVPGPTAFPGRDEANLFKNALHYSDRSLKGFFERARGESWYPNTLFVLVADHGHMLPLHRNSCQPERFRIPLLFYGEVLKKQYRGVKTAVIGSQSDIAATILAQLDLGHAEFEWSNNLLNRHRNGYAFYNYSEGFALRTEQQTTVFDNVSKKVLLTTRPNQSAQVNSESLKDGQAYMQNLYQKYSRL